jgi:hypothetical protein
MPDSITSRGVVHGRTIRLSDDPGLPDGQPVTVRVEPLPAAETWTGEGILRSAGAWLDDDGELDTYLDWLRQRRKQERPEITP